MAIFTKYFTSKLIHLGILFLWELRVLCHHSLLIGFLKIYSCCRTRQKTFKRNVKIRIWFCVVCMCVCKKKTNVACSTAEKNDKSVLPVNSFTRQCAEQKVQFRTFELCNIIYCQTCNPIYHMANSLQTHLLLKKLTQRIE